MLGVGKLFSKVNKAVLWLLSEAERRMKRIEAVCEG